MEELEQLKAWREELLHERDVCCEVMNIWQQRFYKYEAEGNKEEADRYLTMIELWDKHTPSIKAKIADVDDKINGLNNKTN
jgi:hypothetical protein